MLSYRIKKFFKRESLNIEDQMYLIAKSCRCNACVGFTASFSQSCSKEKLNYLNSKS